MEQADLSPETEKTVIVGKQPWLGILLTAILPGLGHLYAKKYLWALFVFLGYIIISLFFFFLFFYSNISFNTLIYSFLTIIFCWVILFAFHIYKTILRTNSLEFEFERKQSKDPWKAVLLSYFVPGVGHAYLRRGGYFLLFALSYQLIDKFGSYYLHPLTLYCFSLLVAGFVMLHVYHISQPNGFKYSLKKMLCIWGTMFCANIVNLCILFIFVFNVGQLYHISGISMEPTIAVGSQVIVNKLKTFEPNQGDIVVFQNEKTKKPFIHRIIATGGQTVEIDESGILKVDGAKFKIGNINYQIDKLHTGDPRNRRFLNNKYIVPEESYFVIGDNWNNSLDSRDFGPINKDEIIGNVVRIISEEDYERIMNHIF